MGARLASEQLGACEFAASTQWGTIHLSVPLASGLRMAVGVPDVLGHAMCLSHSEGVLTALESWCGQALSFRPVPVGLGREPGHVTGTVHHDALAPVGSTLSVPLSLMQQRGFAPDLLAPSVGWPQWAFEATLAELDDAFVRSSLIHVGDMLLLPDAFKGDWHVSLRSSSAHRQLQGLLDLDEACIEVLTIAAPHDGECFAPWRVVLTQPLQLDLAMAMGWQGRDIALPLHGEPGENGHFDFGVQAQLHHRDRGLVLSGMVVPVLLGAALWVRTLHQTI